MQLRTGKRVCCKSFFEDEREGDDYAFHKLAAPFAPWRPPVKTGDKIAGYGPTFPTV
jgi:hypothetical protein